MTENKMGSFTLDRVRRNHTAWESLYDGNAPPPQPPPENNNNNKSLFSPDDIQSFSTVTKLCWNPPRPRCVKLTASSTVQVCRHLVADSGITPNTDQGERTSNHLQKSAMTREHAMDRVP